MTISKIKMSGGYFKEPTEFNLFKNHKQVATVIYGKNGSGKSSISRAFQEAFNSNFEAPTNYEFSSIEFYKLIPHPNQGYEFMPTSEISIPCYVHNENFTHQTVSFNDTGLEAIVMFGEQIEIKKELDILETNLKTANINYSNTSDRLDEISNPKNTESYFYFQKKIKDKLKEQWAVRHQKINELKTLGRVDDKLFREILNSEETNASYAELEADFQSKLEKYKKLKSSSPIDELKPFSLPTKIVNVLKLLGVELEKPILSEKEQKIVNVYSSLENNKASEARYFLKSSENTCPTCFQNVEPQHKSEVLETIRKILNTDEANRLIEKISQLVLEEYILNFSTFYSFVENSLVNDLKANIEEYNKIISLLKIEQQNKITNPYNPVTLDSDINEIIININESINKINLQIIEFNKEISQTKEIANELRITNKKLAFLETSDLIKLYKEKFNLYVETEKEKEVNLKKVEKLKEEISLKQASLANVEIALDLINSYLQYIFYDKSRIYLVASENTYKIMSRGQPVKPSSLSVGEKNIISLCYFFSTLFKNQNIENLFKNESLLVLDDPLSSFDFENKVGVYSFLRYILNELHTGNPKSKSIIFTHDLDVLYNMSKLYSDIKITARDNKLKLFHLDKKELHIINQENYDEYSMLIQNAYDFIVGGSDRDLNIGNDLRRILEAFSTFNYKCSIEELTLNPDILSKLPSNEYAEYFKNSMYRLILNTESHLKERSKLLLSGSFKEHFSTQEKKRTAKDILMFIYLLDDLHLKFHLKENKHDDVSLKTGHIESWIEQVFNTKTNESQIAYSK